MSKYSYSEANVSCVESRLSPEPREVCIVTPFCGRHETFMSYLRGIATMKNIKHHRIWWDNSSDPAFSAKLMDEAARHDSIEVWRDRNPVVMIRHVEDYTDMGLRLFDVYRRSFARIPETTRYMFTIEDDVELPGRAYERLRRAIRMDRCIATAVGTMRNRAVPGDDASFAIIWSLHEEIAIGADWSTNVEFRPLPEKPFGIEVIGSAHSGCWLTRTSVIHKMGFDPSDACLPHDQAWGYRLNHSGLRIVVDWGVKCIHHGARPVASIRRTGPYPGYRTQISPNEPVPEFVW